MLGEENVSNVPIERFGDRFSLYRTLGKLANVVDEVPATADMPEAQLKAFSAGNRMSFEDKGKPLFESKPTARIMYSCNEKPRFKDPTGAIWRRMLFVKFGRPIAESERVLGMDTVDWWIKSGELPGILMWAIRGLHRLRNSRRFSECSDMDEEIEEYRRTGNPIREFLLENFELGGKSDYAKTADAYAAYRKWAMENGFHPASAHKFGASVKEVFPESKKIRARVNGELIYIFTRIFEKSTDLDF
jgi:P4 family phage/plasmid primase-like protien